MSPSLKHGWSARSRTLSVLPLVLLVLGGCECALPPTSVDGGEVDAGTDAGIPLCAAEVDCNDGRFCNGRELCAPGVPGAAPNGCTVGTPPCGSDDCDEAADRCTCAEEPDADGDGHESLACGGGDCDDHDANRYPGNPETCDPDAHDEDCDDSTFGGVDSDMDGYVSSACCNGDACGGDCDDDDGNTNPSVAELCDARDNNCDGAVDEAGAFCPVGVCIDRRCQTTNWERVYNGPALFDSVLAITSNALGDSFALVDIPDGADLDDDALAEPGGRYLVSLQPDGRVRWVRVVDTSGRSLAVAPDGTIVIQSSTSLARFDPDDGAERSAVMLSGLPSVPDFAIVHSTAEHLLIGLVSGAQVHLISFGTDWTESARFTTPMSGSPTAIHDLAASAGGVVLTGETDAGFTVGTHAVLPGRFVLRLNQDLAPTWGWHLPEGSEVNPHGVAISRVGLVAVGGEATAAFAPEWGEEDWPTPTGIGGDAFAAVFDFDGGHLFTHSHRGPGSDSFFSVDFDDRGGLLIAGLFSGSLPVTPLGVLTSGSGLGGFYALRDATTGFTIAAGAFTGSGTTFVLDTHVDRFGGMLVAGRFHGMTSLVLGSEYDFTGAGYVARIADFDP